MDDLIHGKIGFIGAGRTGFSMGRLLAERCGKGVLSGYFSRSPASSTEAAAFTGSRSFATGEALVAASDIVFVTVPDDAISGLWDELKGCHDARGRVFCHMSGSLTSEVFAGAEGLGAYAASLHPLCAISDRTASWEKLGDAYFTFEGSDAACAALKPVVLAAGLHAERLEAGKKILYHAACVYLSTFVVGLAYEGERLLRESGLPGAFAEAAWRSLFLENARNVADAGPVAALTGPAERGDEVTIRSHLEALGPEERALYIPMTKILSKIADKKHA
jgi:predicted short-subunit dehydrogenase-like oxidoreductase (DUF2520 family)